MAWEENSCICLNMQLIAILSRIGVYCFFDNKPKALQGYCIEDTKQLSRFPAQPVYPGFCLKIIG